MTGPNAATFGETLRQARLDVGWSLRVAARHVGLAASTLNQMELGRQRPLRRTVTMLAAAYDLDEPALQAAAAALPPTRRS